MNLTTSRIEWIVKIFRGIYLFLFGISLLAFVLSLLSVATGSFDILSLVSSAVPIIVSYGIYYGLKNRKQWIPAVVTVLEGLSTVWLWLAIIPTDAGQTAVVFIIFRLLWSVWTLFTIYFFTRRVVRAYFNARSAILF